jgi:predicted nucleic acid-binding protein
LNAYPDSSFLVSLYVNQTHSQSVRAHMATMKEPLRVGSLLRYETCNAIRRLAFRKLMPEQTAIAALAAFDADIDNGIVIIPTIPWEQVHAEAERLSNTHTPRQGNRSFDILHVATALVLGAKVFLSFDARQRALATAEGLKVKP